MTRTILHCLSPAPFGGLESVVRTLALGQQRRGHRVIVAASTDDADHPFVRALDSDGIDVRTLRVPPRDLRTERRLVRTLISDTRPQVLHSHGYRPDILDVAVARACGVATVSTLHGFTGGDWKVRLYERAQLRALRQANAVIAVSSGVCARARAAGIRAERIHTIRNAFSTASPPLTRADARQTLGVAPTDARIGWIGRLSDEKGPDVMLEAFARLADTRTHLSFVGDGPQRDTLAARARALGVADRVTFHGIVPDAGRLLPAFDVFALSSRTEGTPMVVLEAMSAEVPIVATSVGGIPDMLTQDEASLAPSESPDALAAALRDALDRPDAARGRAARARARLDRDFGVEPWLDAHDRLYAAIQE